MFFVYINGKLYHMNTQLFIPEKIKVGYNTRDDTYTGKLGYIIYYDQKGILRKEKSFESWRDKELDCHEFENVPTSGFILNKKAGGNKYSYNPRQTYSRVYDPRGFEFEITIPNLLYILQECDCTKGKGLDGEFVYSWDGKDLVLLPAISNDYKECMIYTGLQSCKMSVKDLKEGFTYIDSSMRKLIYLGKYNYTERQFSYQTRYNEQDTLTKKYIFIDTDTDINNEEDICVYHTLNNITTIKQCINENIVNDFSTLLQNYLMSPYCSKFIGYEISPIPLELLVNRPSNSYTFYKKGQNITTRFFYEKDNWVYYSDGSRYYNRGYNSNYAKILSNDEIVDAYEMRTAYLYENNSKIKITHS